MLSRRQTEIVTLVAAGLSNREIAERLWLSERTVESHVASLFIKLDARSRTELATRVFRDGLAQVPKTNLPLPTGRLIGREREIEQIRSALFDHPLVTLTGPGGVGKTRVAFGLAAQLSDRFRDGVWLTELAPVADGHRVVASIAQAVGIERLPENRPLEGLIARLRRRSLLLVIDNCEHLIAQTAVVADALLRGCPGVRLLATSREALKVAGERIYLVPPLDLPAAAELFVERARQINWHFALTDADASFVAAISRRLDGIPLAIELAAARVNVLSLEALTGMLDRRFTILTHGRRTTLPHHQTMRALFDWSYKLLSPPEQRLFDRLSVFAGGWTLQLADAVCAGDGVEESALFELMASLVDKSLVVAELEAAEPRYRLSESAREYAREKLAERGEHDVIANRHARGYRELAEQLEGEWETTAERAWLAKARPELENWRAALSWSLSQSHDVVTGQRLAGALRLLFGRVGPVEGRRWIHLSLDLIGEHTPLEVRAKLDYAEAGLASAFSQHRAARAAAERALVSYRALGEPVKAAFAQTVAAGSLTYLGDIAEGERLLHDALATARDFGNRRLLASVLSRLAYVAQLRGDIAEARTLYEELLHTWKALSAEGQAAIAATNFAEFEFQVGDTQAALRLARDALAAHRALGQTHNVVQDLLSIAAFLVTLASYEEAQSHTREAFDLVCELQYNLMFAVALQRVAAVALSGQPRDVSTGNSTAVCAAKLLAFVDALLESLELRRHYIEQQEYDWMLVVLRAQLGSDELARLTTIGVAMTEDEAIAEARLIA